RHCWWIGAGSEVADPIKLACGLRTKRTREREQLARQRANERPPVHSSTPRRGEEAQPYYAVEQGFTPIGVTAFGAFSRRCRMSPGVRKPRFPMFAQSRRWKILGRSAKGCFAAPAPKGSRRP